MIDIVIPLSNGGQVIVDEDKYDLVKNMRWNWCHRGVGCNEGCQLILMHNMIAPYQRVSFKNGCKWDCRSANLIPSTAGRKNGKNLYEDKGYNRFQIHRKIFDKGVKRLYQTSVVYGENRSREDAYTKALFVRDNLLAMSREEFIEFLNNNKQPIVNKRRFGRVKYNEILKEWDCFKEGNISNAEMYQSGISHAYQSIY